MNQQLDDYIKQARASGQSDAQIMTSLLQSGWNQAQVNEAFGIPLQQVPQSQYVPPLQQPIQQNYIQPRKGNIFLKIIVTIIIIFIIVSLIGGAVGFFFFQRLFGTLGFFSQIKQSSQYVQQAQKVAQQLQSQTNNQTANSNDTTNSLVKVAIHCEDLLSKTDMSQALGINASDIVVSEESGGDCAGNSTPNCTYTANNFLVSFNISSGMGCDSSTGASITNAEDSYNETKGMFCGQNINQIKGLGSEAVSANVDVGNICGITFLSSNKKYYATKLLVISLGEINGMKYEKAVDINNGIKFGKIIDNNLNKY